MIGSITIEQEQPQITIAQEAPPVITVQQLLGSPITIQGGAVLESTIQAFTATATTNNQTVFTPLNSLGQPVVFTSLVCLFIMGIGQNILAGDYTISNGIITLSQGIPNGYTVFGAGQR